MTTPVLSILVCGVARRLTSHTTPLLEKLLAQARGLPVEVLCLVDNYTRTTGAKRNALLALAQGEYEAFVDDDDDVAATYVGDIVLTLAAHPGIDLVTFGMEITNDGQCPHIRTHDRQSTNPIHTQVLRTAIARCGRFPDANLLEDQEWTQQIRAQIGSEVAIDQVLYFYRWQSGISESRADVTGSWAR